MDFCLRCYNFVVVRAIQEYFVENVDFNSPWLFYQKKK